MKEVPVQITAFVLHNNFGVDITLVLEPEGDCIPLADGQVCKILPATLASSPLECEVVLGCDKTITLYLSLIKEVYVDTIKVR